MAAKLRGHAEELIREQSATLWQSLSKNGMRGRTVTVKLRTPDFTTATRQITPPELPGSGDRVVVESLDAEQATVGGKADLPQRGQIT